MFRWPWGEKTTRRPRINAAYFVEAAGRCSRLSGRQEEHTRDGLTISTGDLGGRKNCQAKINDVQTVSSEGEVEIRNGSVTGVHQHFCADVLPLREVVEWLKGASEEAVGPVLQPERHEGQDRAYHAFPGRQNVLVRDAVAIDGVATARLHAYQSVEDGGAVSELVQQTRRRVDSPCLSAFADVRTIGVIAQREVEVLRAGEQEGERNVGPYRGEQPLTHFWTPGRLDDRIELCVILQCSYRRQGVKEEMR